MEHHEADFFGSHGSPVVLASPPVLHRCAACGREFLEPEDLAFHSLEGHGGVRPILLLRGRECARSRITITEQTEASDWAVLDTSHVSINGRESPPSQAGVVLSTFANEVVSVLLRGDGANQVFDLRFSVPQPEDLAGIDTRLQEMVQTHQLTLASVEGFLAATETFRTAHDYRAGIATYLYGVLARERSRESGLEHDAYRDRYDEAVSLLGGYHRPPADAICGLVAFHYSQFKDVAQRGGNRRLKRAAIRLEQILQGQTLGLDQLTPIEPQSLDYVLSDALTEEVIRWCCIALDGSSLEQAPQIEAGLERHEPYDQFKLRLILAEHYVGNGDIRRGRYHLNFLRHHPAAHKWVLAYQRRLELRGDT